ncbi:hypothetical protein BGZ90_010594 [Linnemannia elongata]|nr:hypothetical protein BGZ90_010594 [Linnemannia elongata]
MSHSRPTLTTFTSHRTTHISARRLQHLTPKDIRQTLSKARTKRASPSVSATAFRDTPTISQRVASLSTRKVATLTPTATTRTGIESFLTPSTTNTGTTTIKRYSRRIVSPQSSKQIQLQRQPGTSTNTSRTRVANTTTTTTASRTASVPVTNAIRGKQILHNWVTKAALQPGVVSMLSGSAPLDSNHIGTTGVIATTITKNGRYKSRGKHAGAQSASSTASSTWTTAFPSYDPFSLPKPRQATPDKTTQTRNQNSEPLPFLDFRTNDSREVMYTKCDIEADQWLNSNPSKMWALDAEWKAFGVFGKQAKMALIQLGDDRTVYLFHVIHMKRFPEALARILQDKSILKVGINIRNDATKMFKDWGVGCASLVELGALSIQVQDDLSTQRKVRSMERLSRELLQHAVEKVPLTRMGNWESKNLSANQLSYAANDVFVTYELAEKIKELQKARPNQDYVVPLATVHNQGTTERVDRPATAKDIIVFEPKQPQTVLKTRTSKKDTMASADDSIGAKRSPVGYAKVSKTKTGGSGHVTTSWKTIGAVPSSSTTSSRSTKPVLTATLASRVYSPARSTNVNGDPYFFYPNANNGRTGDGANDVIRAIRLGSRSTVTIIPPRFQKRSFSCSSLTATSDKKIGSGEVFFPRQLLPKSLEGKDIIERNQHIWLEAGGRDLSEEDDLGGECGEEQDDWHLKQNQALFASLVPPDSDPEDSDKGPDARLEVGVDKDVLAALLRKKP